jgi:FKBP-type peptidyl-prolyl cis-trans isomerase FkpA
MKYLILFFCVGIAFSGCKKKKDDSKDQAIKDQDIIVKYISDNNLTATETDSGLYIVTDAVGTGSACTASSDVRVAYEGHLTNGTVFDQSSPTGITFNLQNVIKGWTEGIPHFKEGGSGILLIPSALGYGASAQADIPANSVLIFKIKLIEVL